MADYFVWFYLWFWVKIIMCLSLTVHNIIRNFTLSEQAFDIDINQACNPQEIRTLCTSSKNIPFLGQEGHVLRARKAMFWNVVKALLQSGRTWGGEWGEGSELSVSSDHSVLLCSSVRKRKHLRVVERFFSHRAHRLNRTFWRTFRTHRTPSAYRYHRTL